MTGDENATWAARTSWLYVSSRTLSTFRPSWSIPYRSAGDGDPRSEEGSVGALVEEALLPLVAEDPGDAGALGEVDPGGGTEAFLGEGDLLQAEGKLVPLQAEPGDGEVLEDLVVASGGERPCLGGGDRHIEPPGRSDGSVEPDPGAADAECADARGIAEVVGPGALCGVVRDGPRLEEGADLQPAVRDLQRHRAWGGGCFRGV